MKNMDHLREQVMINQFVMVAGCRPEQAKQLLQAANWQFEVGIVILFPSSILNGGHDCCCFGTVH